MEKAIKEKLKDIEKYICENFDGLDMDDPVEEGYFDEYEKIRGANEDEFYNFEKEFNIKLPGDFKELYSYKNGSGYFELIQSDVDGRDMSFTLMSLEEMKRIKGFFQNVDDLLSNYFDAKEHESKKDSRIKPYIFNKLWFPFASYCECCYLMLDFNPDKDGKLGQVICYIHDPDEVVYAAESVKKLIDDELNLLKDMFDKQG